jgi:hypothetical protein
MGTIADLVASSIVKRDLRCSLDALKRTLEKRTRARSQRPG